MHAALQRRVQRYGWDRAAPAYESLWQRQLASAHACVLARAAIAPGARELDIACGTGLVSLAAAAAALPGGEVVGVDLSGAMVEAARGNAAARGAHNARFARMDAERLDLPDEGFDVVLCALGLMYLPDPAAAAREMRRVLRPGGRAVIAIWGDRQRCGWSPVFDIVAAEVSSDVCPLFFQLGEADALVRLCTDAGFAAHAERINATLTYGNADEACGAALVGGPVALAWSRFDAETRRRVAARYVESLAPWREGQGYRIPGEFVVVRAVLPRATRSAQHAVA